MQLHNGPSRLKVRESARMFAFALGSVSTNMLFGSKQSVGIVNTVIGAFVLGCAVGEHV